MSGLPQKVEMPRACPVESSRWTLLRILLTSELDATALGRGDSRSQLNSRVRETPRGKPVASGEWFFNSI